MAYQRKTHRFTGPRMVLNRAADTLVDGEYAIAKDVRSYQSGIIRPRPGESMVTTAAIASGIHTIKRLNDDLPGATQSFARIIGAGTALYTDNALHNALTQRDTGYDGNPLDITTFRPPQSPDSWGYVANANKMSKARTDGTVYRQGILPPTTAPTGIGTDPNPTLNSFQFTTIDSGISTAANWIPDGTVIRQVSNATGTTDTGTKFLYDTGSIGWASVVVTPVDSRFYQTGAMLAVGGETVIIDSIYQPVKTTTVASITYDSGLVGGTGLCTIQLSTHKFRSQVPNAVIQIDSEYVRILSVSYGDDGIPSLRCSTVSNHIVGAPVTGVLSWRAFFTVNHADGTAYTWRFISFIVNSIAANATAIGAGSRTVTLDLSSISGRPIEDTDMVSLIIWTDGDVTGLNEIQVQIVLDPGYTGGVPTNYFLIPMRLSDFSAVGATGATTSATTRTTTLDAQQRTAQRQALESVTVSPDESQAQLLDRLKAKLAKLLQLAQSVTRAKQLAALNDRIAKLRQEIADLSGQTSGGGGGTTGGGGTGTGTGAPSSNPIPIGGSQYVQVLVKVSDVARIGTDLTLSWGNVTGLRVQASWTNPSTIAEAAQINFGGFWIGGTFGPDTGDTGAPYIYRYRYRSKITGAKSNTSPATRGGVVVRRTRVQLVPTASTDAQVDTIDWFRFGGSLDLWKYIGSSTNTAVAFNDDLPDDVVSGYPDLEQDFGLESFTPYPVLDLPRSGTCNASGTMITRTGGDTFNTAWAVGEIIIVGGKVTTVYRVVSTTMLEVVDNIGNLSNVTWFISKPTINGQALPAQWGPFGQGVIGAVMFACGDPNNPGYLYWTNPGDADTASEANALMVTSPSEPLMNGIVHNGQGYVASTDNWYYINPNLGGESEFTTTLAPVGRGLFARFGLCEGGGSIWFVGKDGIYQTDGSAAQKITMDLDPLFPHDGQVGITTNGIVPPDFTQPNLMQLHWGDNTLRYDYIGTDSNRYTLVYVNGGWVLDTYGNPTLTSYYEEGRVHQWLLGGSNGKLYTHSGTADDAIAIAPVLQTGSYDQGDARAQKLYGDLLVGYDSKGINLSVTVGFDVGTNAVFASTQGPVTLNNNGYIQSFIDIPTAGQNKGVYAHNIGLSITWTTTTAVPELHLWEEAADLQPDDSGLRRTDFSDLGYPGLKFIQGRLIEADTANLVRTVKVQSDRGANGVVTDELTLTVQHANRSVIAHPLAGETWTPFLAHEVRLQPTDANSWKLYNADDPRAWIWEPAPEFALNWQTQEFSFEDYWHIRDGEISYMNATANITIRLTLDGTDYDYVIAVSDALFRKAYLPVAPVLHKVAKFRAFSTATFQLFVKDSFFRYGSWKRQGPYQQLAPFGGQSRAVGAAI